MQYGIPVARSDSHVQREIRQSRPFRSKAHEASVALLRTADLLRQSLGQAIAPSGLTFQQYNVLRILRGAGDSGLPTLEISERMVERAPGITRLLDRLEEKALVRRERCLADRRQVLCWPTAAALTLLGALDPIVDECDSRTMSALNAEEQERLVTALDAVRAAHASPCRQAQQSTALPQAQPGPLPTHERTEP